MRRFLEAERRRRPLAMLRLTTPDLVLRFPDGGSAIGAQEHRGRWAGVRAMTRALWLTRWSLAVTPDKITEDGDSVRVRATATARRGQSRLDQPLEIRFQIRGGRICAIEESTPELERWHQFWN